MGTIFRGTRPTPDSINHSGNFPIFAARRLLEFEFGGFATSLLSLENAEGKLFPLFVLAAGVGGKLCVCGSGEHVAENKDDLTDSNFVKGRLRTERFIRDSVKFRANIFSVFGSYVLGPYKI